MAVGTRVVTLDGTGHGTVAVPPCYFVGAKGGNVVGVTAADGGSLGTAFLTRGGAIGCEGNINVSGDPSGVVSLYFDFE
jgi:hypothetical protein